MKPVLFVVVVALLYACANVILERRLPGNPGAVTAAIAQIVMVSLSWTIVTTTRQDGLLRETRVWVWCLVVGVIYFAADLSYFHAYALGIRAVTATTVMLAMPVFTMIINAAVSGQRPSRLQCLMLVFAALMIGCAVMDASNEGKKNLPAP